VTTADVIVYRSREDIDHDRTYRASGTCVCAICGREYRHHPVATDAHLIGWMGPFLHRLCNGELVKL
jgi:hypothetical protein